MNRSRKQPSRTKQNRKTNHRKNHLSDRPHPSNAFFELLESRVLLSGTMTAGLSLDAKTIITTTPQGYTPAQIAQAYGLNQITFTNSSDQTIQGNGSGQTIAIVDPYSDPNIASDLKTFDAQFDLSNDDSKGDFVLTTVEDGGSAPTNASWDMEISLDVEWAHAMAPGADILLVEAPSSSNTALMAAVNYARSQPGVDVVSMSWGGSEFSGETSYDTDFTTPSGHIGVTFVAAAGDTAHEVSYPAASPNVLGVGGTTLSLSSSGDYLGETAWNDTGGGASRYEGLPSYQSDVTGATTRTTPDVAYDANPDTGVAVYDSVAYEGHAGWVELGGTSAGTPQWAALVAIADQGRSIAGEGSLNGITQTLPALYSAPTADFNAISGGSPDTTGLGSPVADQLVPYLVTYTKVTQPTSSPLPSPTSNKTPTGPTQTPPVNNRHSGNPTITFGQLQSNDPAAAAGLAALEPSGVTLGVTQVVYVETMSSTTTYIVDVTNSKGRTVQLAVNAAGQPVGFTSVTLGQLEAGPAGDQTIANGLKTLAPTGTTLSTSLTVYIQSLGAGMTYYSLIVMGEHNRWTEITVDENGLPVIGDTVDLGQLQDGPANDQAIAAGLQAIAPSGVTLAATEDVTVTELEGQTVFVINLLNDGTATQLAVNSSGAQVILPTRSGYGGRYY